MSYFLETHDVRKQFANHLALDDVSINVPEGKIFGLLGPNGAGKSTLIRIINHITAPDRGEINFMGRPLEPEDVFRIGYLPEERGLYKKMKVGEQAIYLARLKGLSSKDARKKLTYWFEKFDIMPWWNKKLEELSKGMQQKVQFIITIVHEPELMIFDEPFSGFDPVNSQILKKEIENFKEKGHTILFSTHNMASVEEICDDIALINHANVVLQGNVVDIRQRFKNNTYDVLMNCSVNALESNDKYDILKLNAQTNELIISKKANVSNVEVFSSLSNIGEVTAFRERIPSMNDIFLKIVGEDINENKKDHE